MRPIDAVLLWLSGAAGAGAVFCLALGYWPLAVAEVIVSVVAVGAARL